MPLSEYEYRMLAQIEKALCAEDPELASRLHQSAPKVSTFGRRFRGAALCGVGLAALVWGLAFKAAMIGGFPILSVCGYLVMWCGAVELVTEPVISGAIRRTKRTATRVARWVRE